MTLRIRRSAERGGANHGWLDTRHTFSFADYHDPAWMSFRTLRVLNDDWIGPGQGFGMHPHRDMEIVTVVRSGTLAHADSLGHKATIQPGEVQRITAGSGIWHSEVNSSPTDPVQLFQLWVFPEKRGLTPSYAQKKFDPALRRNAVQTIVSRDGAAGSLTWHQDARLLLADLDPGQSLSLDIAPQRHLWIQVMSGDVTLGEHTLTVGDGAGLTIERAVELHSATGAEVLLFDLA